MKFKYKNRRFIGLVVMVVCAGFGVIGGPQVAPVVAEVACQVIGCGS